MMRRAWWVLFFAAGCGDSVTEEPTPLTSEQALDRSDLDADAPASAHVVRPKDAQHAASAAPLLTWHGGSVLQTTVVGTVFWGSSWSSPGDKISGLDSFFSGFGGSNYAVTSDEYAGASGNVTPAVTFSRHVIDSSAPSKRASRSVFAVVAEACRQFPDAVSNGFYAVYSEQRRGGANFCAWHSAGTCPNGTTIQVAFFFNLDGDPGCDPQSTVPGQSQGLAALANVSAHELSEARTDPLLNAWYDASGSENADKCAWSFQLPSVTFTNGTKWKLQGEWSNAAYLNGTGYPNLSGQSGCVQGGP
jgi:hypothetical protein